MLRPAKKQAAEKRKRQQEPIYHDEVQAWQESGV
jgi:hypothetical protein